MGRPRKITQSMTATRAIAYLRVSKEDGQNKHGLDVQKEQVLSYLARKGYALIEIQQDDGISGATPLDDRPGLSCAFQTCLAGYADMIVAYAQDRLARSMGVFEDIRNQAIAHKIRIETIDGRILTQKEDFINGDVMSLVSAIERRRISERFYAARHLRAGKDGRGSGPIPYGYQIDAEKVKMVMNGEEKMIIQETIVIDKNAVPAIAEILRLRAMGMTYKATAESLNLQGYRTKTGKEWTSATVQGIERHEELYRTGRRVWDTTEAQLPWPSIF